MCVVVGTQTGRIMTQVAAILNGRFSTAHKTGAGRGNVSQFPFRRML